MITCRAHASTSAMADPGIILAILSAVFNGSFVAFVKMPILN